MIYANQSGLSPQSIEPISLGRYGSILVVADGMGGTNAGEVASAIAIETVQNAFTPENLGDIVTQEGNCYLRRSR